MMNRLCIFTGVTVMGWIGWWGGERAGLLAAFILSGVGGMAGICLGWRIHRDYLG